MAGQVAAPLVMQSVAGMGGYPPDGVGGRVYTSGVQVGGVVGGDESESGEDSGSEDESGSEEEGESDEEGESEEGEGKEGEEGEYYEDDYSGGQGWWDEDGTYHEVEGGGYDLAGEYGYGEGDEDRMLWTCGICNVAVNIFARDDHITSRPHIKAAKKQAGETVTVEPISDESAYVPMWWCTVCDEDMSVFLREEHILGKEHLRKFRKQRAEDGVQLVAPDEPPAPDQHENGGYPYVSDETIMSSMTFPDMPEPRFASHEYKLRESFYCTICTAEFDLSMEEFHLDEVETWECTLCSKTVHPVSKETHLQSERHTIMMSIQEAQLEDFHCDVCRRFYSPVDKEKHLAGMDHHQMVARIELEQQYMQRLEDLRKKAEPPGAPQAPALPPMAFKGKEAQTGQDQKGGQNPWACNLCNEPLLGLSLEGHRRTFCSVVNRAAASAPKAASAKKAPKTKKPPPYDPNVYFCYICYKGVALIGKESHLAGKKHKKKVAKKAMKRARAAKAQAAAGSGAGGAAGTGQPQRPKKPKKKKLPKEWCAVCQTHKKAVGMADHVKSGKHLKKLAAQQRAGGPSTQVAPPQPAPPAPPQRVPPAFPQRALQFLPPQVAQRVPQPQPQSIPQPVPQAMPQPAPATPASWTSPYVTIMGNKFHCKVCVRDRSLEGLEDHLRSGGHKRNVRLSKQ